MLLCPRLHFKSVIVDGRFAYTGSANLTGAGMGAKSPRRRNFEAGIVTTDPGLVQQIMTPFDRLWMGEHCPACDRKTYCAAYPELLPVSTPAPPNRAPPRPHPGGQQPSGQSSGSGP